MPIDAPAPHLLPQNAQGRTTTLSSTGLLRLTPRGTWTPNSSPTPPPSPAPTPSPPNLPISLLTSPLLSSQSSLLYDFWASSSSFVFLQFYSMSHCPLADNDPLSPSPAVPEPHTRPSSHLGHALGHRHRHHQSLTGPPLAFQASPVSLPPNGPPLDNSHLLPDQPTQQQQQQHSHSHSQIPPRNSSLGPFCY